LKEKLQERAKLVMTRYKGRIKEWDVNNEMVHCTYFKKRLGPEIWPRMFKWCREYDPDAILYVNDYSILSGGDLGKYVKQIKGFLDQGMPVGGIGVQGHFRKSVSPEKVKKTLDKLAEFKLPIAITEYDANTDDENAKALALANLYCTAFAHPGVFSITMWGFWENSHWRPNAALWKKDWSETKAAKVYKDLIFKEWYTDLKGKFDSDGKFKLRVFYGEHEVDIAGKKKEIRVLPDNGK
jgi:GH35 family endo-1,4-beta-xylanase